jgi:hypothetical protein
MAVTESVINSSSRRSPSHGRVKQFGKGRQVLRCQRISDKHRNLTHAFCHRPQSCHPMRC